MSGFRCAGQSSPRITATCCSPRCARRFRASATSRDGRSCPSTARPRAIAASASAQLRLPARELGEALALTGRDLCVGPERVHLGMARIRPLSPASRLRSAAVTIPGCTGASFHAALRRELAALPLGQRASTIEIHVGEEKLLRARVRTVVAHSVELSNLRPHASLCIQAHGLGARRHMGAGVFLPAAPAAFDSSADFVLASADPLARSVPDLA
jgi:CRISPR-associated protein Cas6